jgi:hypothetical protein
MEFLPPEIDDYAGLFTAPPLPFSSELSAKPGSRY